MIHRALKPHVHRAIDNFIDEAIDDWSEGQEKKEFVADRLKESNWQMLETIHDILEPFHAMTKELKGNIGNSRMNGAIFDVLPYMNFLLQQLESAKKIYKNSPILSSCINLA